MKQHIVQEETSAPIELQGIDLSAVTNVRSIRAVATHTLLAFCADQGILLLDRRSGLQHIWTVEHIRGILLAKD